MDTTLAIFAIIFFICFTMIYLPIRYYVKESEKEHLAKNEELEKAKQREIEKFKEKKEAIRWNTKIYGEPTKVSIGTHRSDIAVISERLNQVTSRLPEEIAKRKEEQDRHYIEIERLLKEQSLRMQEISIYQILNMIRNDRK